MAFTITTKGKNLFGSCNSDYFVGMSPYYTGQPTVLADRIIFNLPGRNYVGDLAESYQKTLTLEVGTTYTLSFTVTDSAYIALSVTDSTGKDYASSTSTSPITFTVGASPLYLIIYNNVASPRPFTISNLHLQKASQPSQSVSVNDELFGFEGVYDTIESDGSVTKYWSRTTKTTDDSGNFSLTGYASGSNLIVVNNATGQTKILAAGDTVSTGWNDASVTVIYRLATPVTGASFTGSIVLMPGENNIIVPKFGIISVKGKSKYLQG